MTPQSRIETLEARIVDLEQIIGRFKANRTEILRLRRISADRSLLDRLDERLEVNARTMMTLMTSLEMIRAELRREKATSPEGNRRL